MPGPVGNNPAPQIPPTSGTAASSPNATNATTKRVRIGEVLVEEGILTEQQLQRALAEQKATGRLLGEMLVEQGVIEPQVLVNALARRLGYQGCHLRHGLIDPTLLKLIGEEE